MQIYRVQHIIILLTAALFGSVSTVVGQQTPPRLLWAAETDEGIKLYGLFPDYTRIEIGALPDNVQISRQPQEGRAMYNNQGPDDVWSIPIPATMTVSPDGERLVYTAQIVRLGYPDGIVFDEVQNKYLMTGLFLFNATNREHSSRMELNVAPYLLNLAWSPDGTNLLMSPMHLDYSGAEASLPPETFVTDFTGFHTLRSITNTPTQVDTDVFEWLDNETIRYRLQAVTTDGTHVPLVARIPDEFSQPFSFRSSIVRQFDGRWFFDDGDFCYIGCYDPVPDKIYSVDEAGNVRLEADLPVESENAVPLVTAITTASTNVYAVYTTGEVQEGTRQVNIIALSGRGMFEALAQFDSNVICNFTDRSTAFLSPDERHLATFGHIVDLLSGEVVYEYGGESGLVTWVDETTFVYDESTCNAVPDTGGGEVWLVNLTNQTQVNLSDNTAGAAWLLAQGTTMR